jgi:hypothetical protein
MHQMNCREEAAEPVAPDDPTVQVRTPSVYPTPHLNQDRDVPRLELQHRMTDGGAMVHPTVMKKPRETLWRQVLQHRMI